mmetsp:Transcript_38221/g.113278  ORF Transcript_38221/g.113278 Transcript_38221/m.113278 type:complete len:107 (+) Transcript_38221:580-900(+)
MRRREAFGFVRTPALIARDSGSRVHTFGLRQVWQVWQPVLLPFLPTNTQACVHTLPLLRVHTMGICRDNIHTCMHNNMDNSMHRHDNDTETLPGMLCPKSLTHNRR